MRMLKVIVHWEGQTGAGKECFFTTNSDGRQVVGTFNTPNIMREDIATRLMNDGFNVEILNSWDDQPIP